MRPIDVCNLFETSPVSNCMKRVKVIRKKIRRVIYRMNYKTETIVGCTIQRTKKKIAFVFFINGKLANIYDVPIDSKGQIELGGKLYKSTRTTLKPLLSYAYLTFLVDRGSNGNDYIIKTDSALARDFFKEINQPVYYSKKYKFTKVLK